MVLRRLALVRILIPSVISEWVFGFPHGPQRDASGPQLVAEINQRLGAINLVQAADIPRFRL
jgi:hypothetical protein